MLVDDNPTTLEAGKTMLKDAYRLYPVPSGEILLDLLEHVEPDLVLLDIEMPGMSGYEVITILKQNPKWEYLPIIFLTSRCDEGSELEGLSLGAIDYVTKPFSAPLLRQRIENNLLVVEHQKQLRHFNTVLEAKVAEKTHQIVHLQDAIMSTVVDLVEFRDNTTGGHIVRTQKYMRLLVDKMLEEGLYLRELSAWNLKHLVAASQLHDVGKIAISDAILNKPAPLSPEEMEIMKKHVEIGVRAIKRIEDSMEEMVGDSFLRHARLIAGGHHEKWDGSGYPLGLHELDIPLEGRLMAIADVYDALISSRPYKRPMPTREARQIIESVGGSQFDPGLVKIFSKVADQFAVIARSEVYY